MDPEEVNKARKADYPIDPNILNRWSPRSMTGEGMTDEELFPLFEAARWAPSSYNEQPWRFYYTKRETPNWDGFFDLLVDGNKVWAKDASALLVIVSKNVFERNNKPIPTHSLDTGAAWQNLALEGARRGYVVHGMQGFDYEKAKTFLQLPGNHTVEAMVAIGKRGSKEKLPLEIQNREVPSTRKPISEIAFEGKAQA